MYRRDARPNSARMPVSPLAGDTDTPLGTRDMGTLCRAPIVSAISFEMAIRPLAKRMPRRSPSFNMFLARAPHFCRS
ncbi:hypothetical protein D3C87_1843040 [compost metagenome]